MFARAQTLLAAQGYAQYEISNYALAGRQCAHNLNYWRAGAYLGVGAGAHSFAPEADAGRRWANERSPGSYIERIRIAGQARVDEETLSAEQARGEFVFLGLRCRSGFAAASFAQRFGLDVTRAFPHVEGFLRDGLVECVDGWWRLTERGVLFGDSIFATFL
jgi:oxygen-independent coproporphyrinogen-3 oxidase